MKIFGKILELLLTIWAVLDQNNNGIIDIFEKDIQPTAKKETKK